MLDRLGEMKGSGRSQVLNSQLGYFFASLLFRRGCSRAVVSRDLTFIKAVIAQYGVMRERDDVIAAMMTTDEDRSSLELRVPGILESIRLRSARKTTTSSRFLDILRRELAARRLPPETDAIADELHLLPATLRSALHRDGHPIRSLRAQALCEAAKEQLLVERLTLKQIAATLGYKNANSLQVAFKRWTGQAPTVYRRQALRELPSARA